MGVLHISFRKKVGLPKLGAWIGLQILVLIKEQHKCIFYLREQQKTHRLNRCYGNMFAGSPSGNLKARKGIKWFPKTTGC